MTLSIFTVMQHRNFKTFSWPPKRNPTVMPAVFALKPPPVVERNKSIF